MGLTQSLLDAVLSRQSWAIPVWDPDFGCVNFCFVMPGLRTREEEDSCGNRIKEADVCLDSKGKSKVSSLAANLQKQFDRQQVIGQFRGLGEMVLGGLA